MEIGADGVIKAYSADNATITARSSSRMQLSPSNMDFAVKAAMCDGKGDAWTEEEQVAARDRMGIVTITQEEYDLMKSEGTLNASTIYLTYDGGSKV